jgi:peroxiredoxin
MTTTLLIALAALAPAQRPNPHAEIEQKLIGQTVTTLAPAATDRTMPTVLVYWKNPCPHNPAASKLFNGIAEAYAGKVKMHGIVNSDEAGAAKFKEQFTKPYSLLADADKALIKKSGFTRSIVTVLADKEGKVTHVFGGYGAEALNGLNAAIATTLGMEAPTIEALAAAPQRMTYG